MRSCAVTIGGSVAGSIPEANTIRSIGEVMNRPAVRRHVTDINEISPAHAERYDFPRHYPPEFRRDKAFDARYTYALTDIVMGPESGVCWLPEGPVLQESIGSLGRMLAWDNCLHEILRKPVQLVAAGPLIPFPPTGFFHWLLESLPAALRAREASHEATLLVHPGSPRYVRDGVRLFFTGLRQSDVVASCRPVAVSAARFATIGAYSGFVPAADVGLLREHAGALLQRNGHARGRRLYVSRRLARARADYAPPSLDRVFDELGYECVVAEMLDLASQIRLFSSARSIAALHGAGLANMIWAPPGCRIVELFPAGTFNDCYARLALQCGHVYSYQLLEPIGAEDNLLRRLLHES